MAEMHRQVVPADVVALRAVAREPRVQQVAAAVVVEMVAPQKYRLMEACFSTAFIMDVVGAVDAEEKVALVEPVALAALAALAEPDTAAVAVVHLLLRVQLVRLAAWDGPAVAVAVAVARPVVWVANRVLEDREAHQERVTREAGAVHVQIAALELVAVVAQGHHQTATPAAVKPEELALEEAARAVTAVLVCQRVVMAAADLAVATVAQVVQQVQQAQAERQVQQAEPVALGVKVM